MLHTERQEKNPQWVEKNKYYKRQKRFIEANCLSLDYHPSEILTLDQKSKRSFLSDWGRSIELLDGYDQIAQEFHYRCAYCETRLNLKQASYLTQYRPFDYQKTDGYYFWLKWEWFNILLLCCTCHDKKDKTYFPLCNEKDRVTRCTYNWKELKAENPRLINPCVDNPYQHLQFLEKFDDSKNEIIVEIIPVNDSVKGKFTIKALDLNRESLCQKRGKMAKLLRQTFSSTIYRVSHSNNSQRDNLLSNLYLKLLENLCDPQESENSFVGMNIQLLLSWLKQLDIYLNQLSKSIQTQNKSESKDKMLLVKINQIQVNLQDKNYGLGCLQNKLLSYYNKPSKARLQITEIIPEWLKDIMESIHLDREIDQSLLSGYSPNTERIVEMVTQELDLPELSRVKTFIDILDKGSTIDKNQIKNTPDTINNTQLYIKDKLTFTFPIIPVFLQYSIEVEGSQLTLSLLWKKLLDIFSKIGC